MLMWSLFQCRSAMIGGLSLLLVGSVLTAYGAPSCEDLSDPKNTIVKVTSWSSCTSIDETDGSRSGCYSGKQERSVQFTSNSSNDPNMKRKSQCTEHRRCLVIGRACDGVWSLWEDSACDCLTKLKTQTRYCNTRQRDITSSSEQSRSIHCLGSLGRFESNRTSSCKPGKDDCKETRKQITKPTEASTDAASSQTLIVTSAVSSNITLNEDILNRPTTKELNPMGVSLASYPILETGHIVAIAVGSVLAILVVIFALYFRQRRRTKPLDNEERRSSAINSHQNGEVAVTSPSDERCYATNDLYQDSLNHAELEIDSPASNEQIAPTRTSNAFPSTTQPRDDGLPSSGTANDEDMYWTIAT